MERSIVHLNVADFAVAVERVLDSRLKDRPVIVAPGAAARAVVYDMSEEAYRQGVQKGMSLHRARKCCPDAWILPPHPDRYERAMRRLLRHAMPYSPLVEMTDVKGHLFVDVTGVGRLFGPPPDVAWRIRKAVRADMNFDPIWSVAPNKLLAKVATRLVKPTGEYIVGAGDEAAFLAPVPIYLIPGIESADLKLFYELNLTRAGDAAQLSLNQMTVLFKRHADDIYRSVRGIDPSPVIPAGRPQSRVAGKHVFGDDTNDAAMVHGIVYGLVEKLCARLRGKRLAARRVTVTLGYSDGLQQTRSAEIEPASANDFSVFAAAEQAVASVWKRRVRIRSLRVACRRLTYPPAQRMLFPQDARKKQKSDHLVAAVDTIRTRFGDDAIRFGRTFSMGCRNS